MSNSWVLLLSIFFCCGLGIVALVAGLRYHRRWLADYQEKDYKYRLLVENANDIVYSLTMEGVFTYVSPTWTKLLGHTAEEVENHPFQCFVHPDDLPLCLEALNNAVKTENKPTGVEYRVLHKDGTWRWHTSNAAPIYDADGTVVSYMGIARDITDRKQAEEALQHEKDFAEAIIETAQAIVLVLDPQGRIVRFNPYLEELSGRTLAEMQGKDWIDSFLPERYREQIRTLFLKAVGGMPTLGFENPIVTKDGRERMIEWYDKTLRDAQGAIIGLLSIGQDITDRYRAEQALRESEERYRLIAENTADSIVVTDLSLKNIYVSPSTAKLKGFSVEEVLTQTIEQVMTPTSLQIVYQAFEEEMALEQSGTADPARSRVLVLEEYCKDGSTRWIENTLSFIRDDKLTPTGILSISRDITDRKRAEEALRTSEERYRQLVDNTDTGFVVIDDKGAVISANEPYRRLAGVPATENIVGRSVTEWTAPGEKENNARAVVLCLEQGFIQDFETAYQHADGSRTDISIHATVETASEGKKRIVSLCRDITDRRRAEDALKESQALLKTLIDTLPDLVWLKNPEGIYLICNQRFEKFFGAKEADIVGKTDYDFMDKELADFFRAHDRNAIAAGKPTMNEERITFANDGHQEMLETIKTPIFGKNGKLIGVLGIGRDITVRKRTEEALQKSEEKFRKAFHIIPESVVLSRLDDGVMLSVNEGFLKSIGYSREEVIGKSAEELKIWNDPNDRHRIAETVRGHGLVENMETTFRTKNGEIRSALISATSIDIDGVPHLLNISRDISDRKKNEEMLRESERSLRSTIDGLSAHIAVLDEHGTILLTNKAWRDFAEKNGVPAGYVSEGSNYLQICDAAAGEHSQEAALFAQGIRDILSGKSESFISEYPCNGPDKKRWFIGRVTLFPGEGPRRAVIAHENNTKRKLLELEREEMLAALQDKNEEMESMLYASSHDLRTPLVSIQGFNSLLQLSIKELTLLLDTDRPTEECCAEARPIITEKMPTATRYIAQSAAKMNALVDGILKLSRLGRATHTPGKIDMNSLVRQILSTLDFQIKQAQATVTVGNLPSCWGDLREMEQAFTNLISNAVKYRDPARPLTVGITGSSANGLSTYCIEDNGIGIKPEHSAQIWGLFARLDPNGPVPGEGLGLAMVKRIAQRNHGKVWVESEKGKGSNFCLSLPQDREPQREVSS